MSQDKMDTAIAMNTSMNAVIYTRYGPPDLLHVASVPKPMPKENEVLINIRATGLNAVDWRFLRANPFFIRFFAGMFKPKNQILGADIAGIVEAVGANVTQFKAGDAVYGDLADHGFGGLADYVCAPATLVATMPANLSFEEAAAVPLAGATALQGLRKVGHIQPGQKVLIYGASGGVGTYAVQIAKALGAEVTAVCSTKKMAQARSLGAEHVIDYTKEDFAQNDQQYDLILAANGDRPLSDYVNALSPTGRYIMVGGSMKQMLQAILLGSFKSQKGGKTVKDFTAKTTQADLLSMNELIEAGKVTPVIDRQYPLDEVPDAMRYLEAGHANGKIVIVHPES